MTTWTFTLESSAETAAFVEAMQAEAEFDPASSMFTAVGVNGGEFDQEKVARAGLEAIRAPGPTVIQAGVELVSFYDLTDATDQNEEMTAALSAMIDAIQGQLKKGADLTAP